MHILWYTLVSLLLGSPLCCQISVFVFSKELMSCDPMWDLQPSRLDQSALSSFPRTLAWLHAGGPLRCFKFPDGLRLPGFGPVCLLGGRDIIRSSSLPKFTAHVAPSQTGCVILSAITLAGLYQLMPVVLPVSPSVLRRTGLACVAINHRLVSTGPGK